jgi:cyanate permease
LWLKLMFLDQFAGECETLIAVSIAPSVLVDIKRSLQKGFSVLSLPQAYEMQVYFGASDTCAYSVITHLLPENSTFGASGGVK